jgi:4,5-DOPA dioxygenase extradiol
LSRFAFPDDHLPDARLAVPTPEHFLPLLYVSALRDDAEPVSFINDRIELGAIGMTSVRIGAV